MADSSVARPIAIGTFAEHDRDLPDPPAGQALPY